MKIFSILLCMLLPLAAIAEGKVPQKDDQAINQTYLLFAQAFNRLDANLIGKVYTQNACYIPERHDREILHGRANIIELYEGFFDKIRRKNGRIEMDFRVIERTRSGTDTATDVGYYLIRFHPASDTGEPVSEYAGKFVTVSHKQDDGRWLLSLDSSNRSEPKFYFEAKPVDSLYYGFNFNQLNASR